jgi:U3 small nucleolar RNA-associated protein 21
MQGNESLLFKKYRTINQITSRHPLMVQETGDTVHITSVTRDSYNIYDARKMNLVFCGPLIDRIDCAYQRNATVYVASRNVVYATERGDITATFLLPSEPAQSNKRLKLSGSGEAVAMQIAGIGSLVLILTRSELIVTDGLKELYSLGHDDEITGVFHPHTYLNKVVKICRGGKMVLYNISSRKEIYGYEAFDAEITCIEQTPVIDMVCVGLCTGEICFLNLKTGKTLFSLSCKGAVKELSFGGDNLMCVADGEVRIFDLNERKMVCSREWAVLSGRFIDAKSLVVSTESAIAMYELDRYELVLIKRRGVYNGEIVGVEFQDKKNLLVFGTSCVSSINLYRDEQGFEFKYKGAVEMHDVGKNIVCYGEKALFVLDFANKNSRFIFRKRVGCLAVYRDFCCLGCGDLILVNLRSKLVHREIKIPGDARALAMDLRRIVAATETAVLIHTFSGELLAKIEMTGVRSVRIIENFVVCLTSNAVHFYDENIGRSFGTSDVITDYCISHDMRWIGVLYGRRVLLYDIVTAALLDTLELAEDAKLVRFSPNLDFLVVVLLSNDIVLLSNKTYFVTVERPEETALSFSELQAASADREQRWERSKKSFYMELLLLRGLARSEAVVGGCSEADTSQAAGVDRADEGSLLYNVSADTLNKLLDEDWIKTLDKEQVLRIMELMVPHMHDSMELVQRILFKMLKNKSHMLGPDDVLSFCQAFDEKWLEYEGDMLKTIGYLGTERDRLS